MLPRIISKGKRAYNTLVFNTPFDTLQAGNIKRVILCYHGVDTSGKNLFNKRHTSAPFFEQQLIFLKKKYQVISLADFFEGNFDKNRSACAITFDDGYLNNYTLAAPILEKHSCKASFFITGLNKTKLPILWADYVNIAGVLYKDEVVIDGERFKSIDNDLISLDRNLNLLDIVKHHSPELDYKYKLYEVLDKKLSFVRDRQYEEHWKLMDDQKIAALSRNPLFEIGSHGYYHNDLGDIQFKNASEELNRSKDYLESLTQKPVVSLAYPDGSYSPEVVKYAANTGLKYQLAIDGFLFDGDGAIPELRNRSGVYNIGSAANQLLEALNRNKNVRN